MTLSAATRNEIQQQKERYPQARSAVLPALWALQHEVGYLSVEGMREVAEILGLFPSEVQAVAGFYSMYFTKPDGDHHALVCINVSCALRGADEIVAHIGATLGCGSGETSADGSFTWESTVECLGACGGAPAMQVDHHFHENLTPESVDAIFDHYRSRPGHDGHPGSGPATPIEPFPAGKTEAPAVASSSAASRRRRADAGEIPGAASDSPDLDTKIPGGKNLGAKAQRAKRPRPSQDDL